MNVKKLRGWLIVVSIVLVGCSNNTVLYSDLSEKDANEMIALLNSEGIEAHKTRTKKGLISLEIDEEDFSIAMNVLKDKGLPREQYTDLGKLFEKTGLVSTPAEERTRFIYGVTQELSNTISEIDGVLSARIHIVKPTKDPVTRKINHASASVVIRHKKQASIKHLKPQLKSLIANSVEGLNYDRVAIIFISV